MYLTTHLVRTPAHDRGGINTFIYTHRGAAPPGIDWAAPDVRRVAEETPGSLVAAVTSIAPGGNEVLAWLDVVAADELSGAQVASDLPAALPVAGAWPATWRSGRLGLRCGTVPGLEPRAASLFGLLVSELRRVLARQPRRAGAPRPGEPLRATRAADAVGFRYELTPGSRARLRTHASITALPRSLGVTYANQADFSALFGDPYAELTRVLTGLDVAEVNARGGLELCDERGTVVWDSRQTAAAGS